MLDVRQLSIEIDGKSIVQNSSFSVPLGKITSIIGESGSGKTMTVSALLGIIPTGAKVTGQAIFYEENLITVSDKEMKEIRREHLFTIFQDAANSFNPSMKMRHQLFEFSGRKTGDTIEEFRLKMEGILHSLGLASEIMEQYPFELSGGMLQRCMIACALYMKPSLLIADEPTSALDMALQKEFIGLLKRLNEQHETTILLITHDLDIVAEVAHDMVVMRSGEVIETGSVAEVFNCPKHPYTKLLLDSRF